MKNYEINQTKQRLVPNMFTRYRILLLLWAIILGGCNSGVSSSPKAEEFVFPTYTLTPIRTIDSTISPTPGKTDYKITIFPTKTTTPTKTPTLPKVPAASLTPTPPFPPYSLKPVYMEYRVEGPLSKWSSTLGIYHETIMVMYSDGQLIINRNGSIMEKLLSKQEVCSFLSKLNQMGFYSIETNQAHDQTDPLYNFSSEYRKVYDALYYSITLSGDSPRTIYISEPYKDYLVQPMKNILSYLDNYSPVNMTPYQPDRLVLLAMQGRNMFADENAVAIPLPEGWPTLKTPDQKIIYFEGIKAAEVFKLFDYPYNKVFVENNQEYTVMALPILPHENLGGTRDTENNEAVSLPFDCNQ